MDSITQNNENENKNIKRYLQKIVVNYKNSLSIILENFTKK